MNIIVKRFLAFSLSFVIIFSSVSSANAATSVGGWTALDTITAGANNTINAVKGAGATGMRSAVSVAPSVAKVGKNLIKGGGSTALAFAMVELLDAGVDWVLDPANNSVKYKPTSGSDGTVDAFGTYTVVGGAGGNPAASTAQAACSAYVVAANAKNSSVTGGLATHKNPVATASVCAFDYTADPKNSSVSVPYSYPISFKPSAESGIDKDGYKHIPIGTVAAKVIANAEAGHAPSQEAVKAVALEGFAAGEHDAALDASAVPDSNVDTENPPTDTPTDPAKPFDPSSIIEAIASLKATLAGILSSITSLSDFFKEEPPAVDEDTVIEIPDNDVLPADTDINFGGSCPANFEVNSSIFGNPINIVLLDTAKFCGFLSTFVKYPVYAVSSLFALYILGGRKDV